MNAERALSTISSIFSQYHSLKPTDSAHLQALNDGKLYEFYVLSQLLTHLRARGFLVSFHGTSLRLKGAPGKVSHAEPHFTLTTRKNEQLEVVVDIEFETLGNFIATKTHNDTRIDYSIRHAVDILVVKPGREYPHPSDIYLAVECKSTANFTKRIVKEVLGIRRELSIFQNIRPSCLSDLTIASSVLVPAEPASEFWLAYIDPKGNDYQKSPSVFGIEFNNFVP